MSLTKSEQLASLKRWIVASYKQQLPQWLPKAPIFTEGEDRSTSKEPRSYELRIDGPYFTPNGSPLDFKAYIEVSILANWTRDENNIFMGENLQGQMLFALNRDFCINRTGNEGTDEADTNAFLGMMQLLESDRIKVSTFGRVDAATELYQASAEGHYEMHFTLENP